MSELVFDDEIRESKCKVENELTNDAEREVEREGREEEREEGREEGRKGMCAFANALEGGTTEMNSCAKVSDISVCDLYRS